MILDDSRTRCDGTSGGRLVCGWCQRDGTQHMAVGQSCCRCGINSQGHVTAKGHGLVLGGHGHRALRDAERRCQCSTVVTQEGDDCLGGSDIDIILVGHLIVRTLPQDKITVLDGDGRCLRQSVIGKLHRVE